MRVPIKVPVHVHIPLIEVRHLAATAAPHMYLDGMPEAVLGRCPITFVFGDGLKRTKTIRSKYSWETTLGYPRSQPAHAYELEEGQDWVAERIALTIVRHGVSRDTEFTATEVHGDGAHGRRWTFTIGDDW